MWNFPVFSMSICGGRSCCCCGRRRVTSQPEILQFHFLSICGKFPRCPNALVSPRRFPHLYEPVAMQTSPDHYSATTMFQLSSWLNFMKIKQVFVLLPDKLQIFSLILTEMSWINRPGSVWTKTRCRVLLGVTRLQEPGCNFLFLPHPGSVVIVPLPLNLWTLLSMLFVRTFITAVIFADPFLCLFRDKTVLEARSCFLLVEFSSKWSSFQFWS